MFDQITPYEALVKEILFAIEVWKMRKPVRLPTPSSSTTSSSTSSSMHSSSSYSSDEKINGIHLNRIGKNNKNTNGFDA